MNYSTTDTYKMKREIINFTKKFSSRLSSPEGKFLADMTYGIVSSKSCLLTQISQRLQEDIKKRYTVDRLSDHLSKGIPEESQEDYLRFVRSITPCEPVIHIDDSDVVKPEENHFGSLGIVRDGSRSTPEKSVYCKGYHVTEACVLTSSNHTVSIFSELHSSEEKSFTSMNSITFAAMERGSRLFKKAAYVMDRGYDGNKMFQKLWELGQDFVIRLTQKRKLFFHRKWVPATELCAQRKGKVKLKLFYRGKEHEAYISHVKVQLTAAQRSVYLVLVYGITEHPMMLVTNKAISNKDDVIKIARLYFSRWRIEEYFRDKKQIFDFENFRVRKLKAINALNFYIGIAMCFLAHMTRKNAANALLKSVLEAARPIKDKVQLQNRRRNRRVAQVRPLGHSGLVQTTTAKPIAAPFSLTCLKENNYIPFWAQLHFVIAPGSCAVFLFYSQFLPFFHYLPLILASYFVTLDI